jgi:hypothetical protein
MATAAQCAGKVNVLSMFKHRRLQAFSIWSGKQFLFTGIGEDELSAYLDMMQDGSNACYTLKVYKGISDNDDITEKTPANGSFNFYVKQRSEVTAAEPGQYRGNSMGAISRVIEERLAEKISRMLDEEENPTEPEEDNTIAGILQQPEKLKAYGEAFDMFASIAQKLFNRPPAAAVTPMQLAAVGNATRITEDKEVEAELSDKDQERLIKAINTLSTNDPKCLEHLEKLARMSVTNKQQFSGLLSMLDMV